MIKGYFKKVDIERTCGNCVGFNGDTWCQICQCPTRAVNYGCNAHLTKEEWEKKVAELDEKLNSEKAIRVNYMLTLMYTFLNAGMTLMTRCETLLGQLVGGKDWRRERKQAIRKMMANIEEVRSLYARYFEKDFVDMMTQYGQSDFDDRQYDNFTADTADFLRLGLTFYEHAYKRPEDKEKAIQLIAKMPHDLNLFDDSFIESFRIKDAI
jgi:hypothetical protein